MKKFKRIMLILLLVVVLFSAAAYIDYFIVVKKTTHPKIALKKKINDDLEVYNSIFYRVWYCKLNNTYTIGSYKDKDAICNNTLKYDKEGNYTNALNVTIACDNMKLLNEFYSYDAISNMSSTNVEDAIYVATNAYKVKYRYVLDSDGDKQETHAGYYLIQFPELKLNSKDEYDWVYPEESYCINDNKEIALFDGETCDEFKPFGIEKKWCDLYKESNLANSVEAADLCKE